MSRESLERLRASRGLRDARGGSGREQVPVVTVCVKCQRRLLEGGRFPQAAKLREAFDSCAVKAGLRVLEVECLDVCPEGGVAVCVGAQAGRPAETVVVRTAQDVQMAFERRQEQLISTP